MPYHSLAGKFENCTDCSQYSTVDKDGRCGLCANREKELLQTAKQILKDLPEINREELANLLHVDIRRVDQWLRSGKVRCVALTTKCPKCGNPIHQFSCTVCNYRATDEIRDNARNNLTKDNKSYEMHTREGMRTRFNRDRKETLRSKVTTLSD